MKLRTVARILKVVCAFYIGMNLVAMGAFVYRHQGWDLFMVVFTMACVCAGLIVLQDIRRAGY